MVTVKTGTGSKAKAYWRKIHRIQAEHGCSVKEAKARLKGVVSPEPAMPAEAVGLRPHDVATLAVIKQTDLGQKIDSMKDQLAALQAELDQWTKIKHSFDA